MATYAAASPATYAAYASERAAQADILRSHFPAREIAVMFSRS